jgi:hypothetical protein
MDLDITRSLTYSVLSQSLKCLTLERVEVFLAVNVVVNLLGYIIM